MTATTPRFNPLAPGFRMDPYPMYAALRAAEPVHRTLGMWVFTAHNDIRHLLRDNGFSSSLIPDEVAGRIDRLPPHARADAARIVDLGRTSLVFTDDPAHARLRALVNRVFTRQRIEGLRPVVAQRVDDMLDRLDIGVQALTFDLIASLASPLPSAVLVDWMALPPSIASVAPEWTHEVRRLLEPGRMSVADLTRVGRVVGHFASALRTLVDERTDQHGDDLISELARVSVGHGDRLSQTELAYICIMCFVAGTETTTALLGNAVAALLTHPEQSAKLAAAPERAGDAIRETLRYDSPLQMTKRVARAESRYGGQVIRYGDQVLLCLGAGNRDPEVFDAPNEFSIDRGADMRSAASHLGFGHGMHGCLGAALAQLIAQTALERVWRRLELTPTGIAPTWQTESFIMRGPSALPVRGRSR
ncbi:cytochrome P450 [Gordonia sp. i37]|uniref:cytochrome P450 n=1 Tax=Gordonia sp. i37 TaxID=1961707 RepID=UPI0009AEF6A1|nr:cytochrome P450 [Gordonia sp. i37]OPX16547.1 cytochrome [Gordonia sp. i37]